MVQRSQCLLEPGVLINLAPVGLSLGNKSHVLSNLFLLDDVSIWNQSIDIDPDGTEEPVSSRTRSPQKPSTSRSVTGQQISCTAHLFVLDDVSIWNQSIDIDPDGTEEPVSSRTRSPHKPSTSRSVTGQQISCTRQFVSSRWCIYLEPVNRYRPWWYRWASFF